MLDKLYREGVIDCFEMLLTEKLLRDSPSHPYGLLYLIRATRLGNLCVDFSHPQTLFPTLEIPLEPLIHPQIHVDGNRCYLARFWEEETRFLQALQNHFRIPPSLSLKIPSLPDSLLPEQKEAIYKLHDHPLLLLTGGPGTGKSFTAAHMVKCFPSSASIAIAAPTGKAASHLKKGIDNTSIEAFTLHRLLKQPHLHYDLLLVDEASMIDAQMMIRLFEAIKPGSRLVLIGDAHQLPPIGSGAFFADLTKISALPVIRLKKTLRTEQNELLNLAEAIRIGETPTIPLLTTPSPEEQNYATFRALTAHIAKQKVPTLTPLREGLFGTERLNQEIVSLSLQNHPQNQPWTAPIIIEKNDYTQNLFNGEIGTLTRHAPFHINKSGDFAQFGDRRIPALLLPAYSYAFCLSIHKSQGSEFDSTLILLPEGSERFGREVLYTAVTRARHSLTLWTTKATLNSTLAIPSTRLSGLIQRFNFFQKV
ncbi:MAG: AAA family ATPase [Chlamydiia bacterium]|nr:AAA family ATPase [Chlamydiia bacterium]